MNLITRQNETIDGICQRIFGRTAGVTEQVLRLNPGLTHKSPILPQGMAITLPDAPAQPQHETANLWS